MAQVKKLKSRRPPPLPEKAPLFHWWATWPVAWLLLSIAGVAAYSNSLSGPMFFDDLSSILGNPYIQTLANPKIREEIGWKAGDAILHPKDSFEERRARGTLGWIDFFWSPIDNPLAGRPIVQFSFTLNQWWAAVAAPSQLQDMYMPTQVHAWYFHVVNLALHIAVSLVLWSLLRRTLRSPAFGGRFQVSAPYWAFAVALVWLVHPLNTETVVYVTQRTELVLAFFFLLTFYFATRSITADAAESSIGWQIAAVAACALGMASKENMIAAPILLVLFERAFFFETWRETFERRGKFYAAIFSTYAILGWLMLQNPRGESVGFHHERMPWYEYLITQCWCLWRYFWLSFVPLHWKLCVDYGRRPVLDFFYTAPGALLVFAGLAATVWGFVRKPWVAFLGCWYFFILAPTSSFVPIVTEVGAERRMYLPLIVIVVGMLFAAVAAAAEAARRAFLWKTLPDWSPAVGAFALFLVAFVFGAQSRARNDDYLTEERLYGHIVDVFPDNDRGNNNFAKINVDLGKNDRALELLNEALYIDPEYSDAYTNRGIIFHHIKRFDIAIQNATKAIDWNPINVSAWNNRGNAFMEIKEFDRALHDFSQVIRITPFSSDGYFGRANVYFTMGNAAEEKWIKENPGRAVPSSSENPGLPSFEKALADCDAALKNNPNDYKCYNTKGNVLKKMQRPQDAIDTFSTAVDMIRREALSWKHPFWPAVEQLMDVRRFDQKLHPYALSYPHRSVLAAIFGNRADAYRMLWETKNDLNAREMLFEDLTRAIVFDPQNPDYFRVRGFMNLKLQRFEQALVDLNQTLALNQIVPEVLHGHLQAAVQLRRFDLAWQDAKRLRDMGMPLNAGELAELRQRSGMDYPP